MKGKILLLCVLFVGIMSFATTVMAEPAIIKDLVIDTQDSSVKITITSSQTLQIETFKNDESPANYIVLDFIGSVYTRLPSIIDVGKAAVEDVRLVRGEESQIIVDGKVYYSLDFLAINLTSAADYRVNQSQSVIDLSIGASSEVEGSAASSKAVDLLPPIVISREQTEPVSRSYEDTRYEDYSLARDNKPQEVKELSFAEKKEQARQKRKVKKAARIAAKKAARIAAKKEAREKTKAKAKAKAKAKKKKGKGGFLFFGKKKEADTTAVPDKQVPTRTTEAVRSSDRSGEGYLIDMIVDATIRKKQQTMNRIDNLTMELKGLQDALYLSKGQKSQLDEKISEILAKLDELKGALDDEIRRRQALGEKVDGLIAQRHTYIKAKKDYEHLQWQLNRVSISVDNLNSEFKNVSNKLKLVRFEKRKLEANVDTLGAEYSQVKGEYDNALNSRDSITLTIEKASREIEELRRMRDRAAADKTRIASDLKNLETQTIYNGTELARLKKLLQDKNVMLIELSERYDHLKVNLDSAVSEKFKVEYAYRNAKTEFERIKREIEAYLQSNR